jgi:N-methylhydantoinase B
LGRSFAEVARDVRHGLVSRETARSDYGVVLDQAGDVDRAASETLRQSMRTSRGELSQFDFGELVMAMRR